MNEMGWWEFTYLVFIQTGLWIFLVAAWLVFCFVLGVVVFMSSLLKTEYEYYHWRKSVEASHTAAKKRAAAKKKKEVDNGNSSNNTRVNRDSGRVISNAPLN